MSWEDAINRDSGCYRTVVTRLSDGEACVYTKVPLIQYDEMEDAIIAALDAGMTAEEIADIQLGCCSL